MELLPINISKIDRHSFKYDFLVNESKYYNTYIDSQLKSRLQQFDGTIYNITLQSNDPNNPPIVNVYEFASRIESIYATPFSLFNTNYFIVSWFKVPGAKYYKLELGDSSGVYTTLTTIPDNGFDTYCYTSPKIYNDVFDGFVRITSLDVNRYGLEVITYPIRIVPFPKPPLVNIQFDDSSGYFSITGVN